MRLRSKVFIASGLLLCITVAAFGGFLFLLLHRTSGHYFDSNGVQIFYTIEGGGAPVILIHGIAANADLNWRRPGITRALARDFQVISFDLRGHGLSGKPTDPEAYGSELVKDIVRLMDHLDLEKAHIAGYSLGGFIALKAVTTEPERFMSAAICAAGWKDPDDPSPVPNPYQPPKPPAAKETAQAAVFAFAQQKSLFHRIRNSIGDRLMDEVAKKAIKRSYEELAVHRSALELNTVPLYCAIGDRDGFLYLARDLADVAADVGYSEIHGANHFTLPFNSTFKRGLWNFFLQHDTSFQAGQGRP